MDQPAQTTTPPRITGRVHTPMLLQMEAVECGAAALGIVLRHYGKYVPLEELRVTCGVSRDGSNALNIRRAAEYYGMEAKGVRRSNILGLSLLQMPLIVFWNFNHFVVVEGIGKDAIYLNDPSVGPRTVTYEEFDTSFTGVVITLSPGPNFVKSGEPFDLVGSLRRRLTGSEAALSYVLLASLFLVIPGLALPAFLRIFVDDILIQRQNWSWLVLAGLGSVLFLRAGLTWVQQSYLLRLETRLAISSSSRFFWHVLRLPVDFFGQRFVGDIANRVQLNDQVAGLLSGELATTVIDVLLIAFYGILMFTYDWILTLIGVATTIINLLILRYAARRRRDASYRVLSERAKLIGTSLNGVTTIETLKATGAEGDFFTRWSGFQARMVNAEQQTGRLTQILNVAPTLLFALNVAVILFVGGLRILSGNITVGMLVAFQSLMLSFSEPVTRLTNLINRLQEAEGSLSRLDDVLKYPTDPVIEETTALGEAETPAKLEGYLELKGVTFGYNPLEPPLVEEFSLTIRPGQRVALVGASGCGKSTVSKLVAGIYEPLAGEIHFDGKPRRDIPRSVMTASVAMVDQTIQLFSGTVRDNLTLWNPAVPRSRIIQAAKDAAIHDQITALPGGFDFHLDENGNNFSGGERQRLEIARALVNDPALLILDEATSALDPLTEKTIDDNLRKRGCSCLIVAHRLSTIRDCDEIIVMEKGKIVQRGTHTDLIRQNGPYADLVGAEKPKENKRNVKSLLDKLI